MLFNMFNKMSDTMHFASERQPSNPITVTSADVAANCHRQCYENLPLYRLSH